MKAALVQQAAEVVLAARHAVALTGAGISTPSGIPDFRSPASGLWQQADPMVVASLQGFRRNPQAFYDWLRPLARQTAAARPNPAHRALAALERAGRLRAVVTQNIDGLQQAAGSRRVLELHGHLRTATCLHCGRRTPGMGLLEALVASAEVPRCGQCGDVVKPDVVLFGELLPVGVLQEAEAEASGCDVMLVAGSSLTVMPASLLPEVALERGARLIIANRTTTELDRRAAVVLREDVAEALPAVAKACGLSV
ncbi:MAG TPA: NAD-dependent deacylase [Anaerolineae bacterium]|nr:NAD-dependent deacylase [Anaerolineae bacterium]HOQ98850.1 NAD-dependent deacylase [Anaerolineae bacterium]HPL27074.1 NAD-dependent deacylase [Anaerolineae bacterium]